MVVGRWVFWPRIPKFDDVDEKLSGFWAKVGNLVERRPKSIWISTAIALVVLAGFSTTLKSDGLSQTEAFTTRTDSVIGLEKLGEHFPSGEGSPVEIVVPVEKIDATKVALSAIPKIANVIPLTEQDPVTRQPTSQIKIVDGKALLYATLEVPADSKDAKDLIPSMRAAAKSVDEAILIGGQTAVGFDIDEEIGRAHV